MKEDLMKQYLVAETDNDGKPTGKLNYVVPQSIMDELLAKDNKSQNIQKDKIRSLNLIVQKLNFELESISKGMEGKHLSDENINKLLSMGEQGF